MDTNKGRESLTSRYLAALLAPAVIAGVMQVFWLFSQQRPAQDSRSPVLPFKPVVIVFSVLLTGFLLIEPYFPSWFPQQTDLVRLQLFAVVGSFISVRIELMYKDGLLDTLEVPRS